MRVYGCEKTLADSFKFRNKIGMDIVLEALELYIEQDNLKLKELLEHAEFCRVKKVLLPSLEAILYYHQKNP